MILMAHKHISIDTYTCDICNREVKESKLHKLKLDSFDYYAAFSFKVFQKYSHFQNFDICNKCYSKLRRYARKLSRGICKG